MRAAPLDRRSTAGVALALACVAALGAGACDRLWYASSAYNGVRMTPPLAKPAVTWERTDGAAFDMRAETAGRVTLLYFGYTHCPDVCPLQLMHLGTALRELGADTAAQLRVLVVSIDPARDTGSVLGDWVHGFHPGFIPLRGDLASIDTALSRLGLSPRAALMSEPVTADPAHAAAVVAFAKDGRAHFLYPANTNPEMWAFDIRKLLRDSVP